MAERLLTHNNRLRTELNYQIVQQNAVPVPSSQAKQQRVNEQYIVRGLKRLEDRIAEEAKKNLPEFKPSDQIADTVRKIKKAEEFENHMK